MQAMEIESDKLWFKRLFVLTCIIVIGVSLGVLISRFGFASPLPAIVASIGGVVIAYIGWQHFALSRDVNNLKIHASHSAHYLEEIERRMELLSQVSAEPRELPDADDPQITQSSDTLPAETEQLNTDALEPKSMTAPVKKLQPLDKKDVRSALKNGELGMHLQPIVELPDRKPAHFEAFMRINNKSKGYLDNKEFRKVAAASGFLPSLEQKVIFASSRILKQLVTLEKPAGIFCSISPETLRDGDVWEKIHKFIAKNKVLASSITLQISQRDYLALNKKERTQLMTLKKLKASVSLSNVLDPAIDLTELKSSGIDSVKCPGSILIHSDHGDLDIKDFVLSFSAAGLNLIADEIEREEEAIALMNAGVALAQGTLFAPPRPVKSDLL